MPGRGSFLDSTGVVMRRSLREKLIASGVLALAAVAVVVATSIPMRAAGPTAIG